MPGGVPSCVGGALVSQRSPVCVFLVLKTPRWFTLAHRNSQKAWFFKQPPQPDDFHDYADVTGRAPVSMETVADGLERQEYSTKEDFLDLWYQVRQPCSFSPRAPVQASLS